MGFHLFASSPRRAVRAPALILAWASVLGVGAGEGVGQETLDSESGWTPGAQMESEVRNQLAARWGVLPEALVLEWGVPRGRQFPSALAGVRLLGTGRAGHWVASFLTKEDGGETQSVLLRAGVMAPRPVARRSLERGLVLGQKDMAFEARLHWGDPKTLPKAGESGWVAQRTIEEGELLVSPAVKPPLLVTSGRPVTLFWSNGSVKVSLQGTAAGSATLGEPVLVRTEDGTRLSGLVEGPGLVRLQGNPTEIGR